MVIYRESSQRKAVLENLTQRHDHPAAVTIYEDLRHRLPNLSLGTVYRNLEILEAQNRIRSLKLSQRQTKYDADMNLHGHFLCRACGLILDLPLKPGCCQIAKALEDEGYEIGKINLDIVGVCPGCNDQHSKESPN